MRPIPSHVAHQSSHFGENFSYQRLVCTVGDPQIANQASKEEQIENYASNGKPDSLLAGDKAGVDKGPRVGAYAGDGGQNSDDIALDKGPGESEKGEDEHNGAC